MEIVRSKLEDSLLNTLVPSWFKVLAVVGGFASLRFLWRILRILWIYFLRPAKSFAKHRANWAVVTGASWGVGHGYAVALAKRGMNIVLMARNEDRLKEIAADLESRFQVKTKIVLVDFGSRDPTIYDTIEQQIKDLQITLLVNNVGITTQYPKYFHETSVEEMEDIIHINVNVGTRMTALILPQMRERKFGTIINVSSGSAHPDQPTPLFAVYSGTKAYNQKFSLSLYDELKREGIEVLAVTPYFVTSKMSRARKGSLLVCTEERNAEDTLNKLGYHMKTVHPWFNHMVQGVLTTKFSFVAKMVEKQVFGFRSNAIKKLAEKEKAKAAEKKTE